MKSFNNLMESAVEVDAVFHVHAVPETIPRLGETHGGLANEGSVDGGVPLMRREVGDQSPKDGKNPIPCREVAPQCVFHCAGDVTNPVVGRIAVPELLQVQDSGEVVFEPIEVPVVQIPVDDLQFIRTISEELVAKPRGDAFENSLEAGWSQFLGDILPKFQQVSGGQGMGHMLKLIRELEQCLWKLSPLHG